jgi:hypothetical protein
LFESGIGPALMRLVTEVNPTGMSRRRWSEKIADTALKLFCNICVARRGAIVVGDQRSSSHSATRQRVTLARKFLFGPRQVEPCR